MSAQVSPGSAEAGRQDVGLVIGTALSQLGGRDFLAEVLDRTKEVVGADTAAVLLLDYSSGHLVAAAAGGLEEEVRQGVRIPVGRGFAGRIAVEHKPVIIDEVDHATVLNPILLAKGIRSLLGVPLMADGRPAKLADVTAGLMIGVDPGAQRQVTDMSLPPGSLLCLYTDGLVERPGEPIDDGLARLCQAITAAPPDAVCSAVMMTLVGYEPPRDDIALLILRRQPPDPARHN